MPSDAYLLKHYGLTKKQYNQIKKDQANLCAICKAPPKKVPLAVDHRHIKGYKKLPPEEKVKEVRGLLCFRCNKFLMGALEQYKDARVVLYRLFEYCFIYKIKGD